MRLTVTVCEACGTDSCWEGTLFCEEFRNVGTKEVQACAAIDDRTGRPCERPEKLHTPGWTHAFNAVARGYWGGS